MKNWQQLVLGLALTIVSAAAGALDLQGHRGARGLLPENTLPAFAGALAIGVSTLELDLAMTADRQLLVMHDPVFEPKLARDRNGDWLVTDSATVRSMSLTQAQGYDVGRMNPSHRYATRFPQQAGVDGTPAPTLAQVFDLVERAGNRQVRFNVEIKLRPDAPEATWPPREFAAAVVELVRARGLGDRVTVQSFDWRALQAVQQLAPQIETAYLSVDQSWLSNLQTGRDGASPWLGGIDIDDFGGSAARAIRQAGGSIWSPYHLEVDARSVSEAQALGLRVIVWTVNQQERMRELIAMGVDGIITDYPDRLRAVMAEFELALPPATPLN